MKAELPAQPFPERLRGAPLAQVPVRTASAFFRITRMGTDETRSNRRRTSVVIREIRGNSRPCPWIGATAVESSVAPSQYAS